MPAPPELIVTICLACGAIVAIVLRLKDGTEKVLSKMEHKCNDCPNGKG
jgi:hypothetical protein